MPNFDNTDALGREPLRLIAGEGGHGGAGQGPKWNLLTNAHTMVPAAVTGTARSGGAPEKSEEEGTAKMTTMIWQRIVPSNARTSTRGVQGAYRS